MAIFENVGRAIDGFMKEAAQHIGPVVKQTWKHAAPAADMAVNHFNAVAQDATARIKESNWNFLQEFGEDLGKQVGATAEEVWGALLSGEMLNSISQGNAAFIGGVQEHLPGLGDRVLRWIIEHPKEATALVACILAAPTTMAVTPAALGLAGFTTGGITAGSLVAGAQAGMGGAIASGSLFSILQSAGAGGFGLVAVKAIAASTSMVGTCSAAAVGFLEAMKKEDCDFKQEE